MTRDTGRLQNKARGKIADLNLLENPLDFIAEDHMQEREVCALIDNVAREHPVDSEDIARVLSFLIEDLPQHLADEEIDLFPMMQERCDPEEEIDKVISRLQADHAHAIGDSPAIAALLDETANGERQLTETDRKKLTEFASQARRHLILENAIVLPLARARLTSADLATMRTHMLERRGQTIERKATHAE